MEDARWRRVSWVVLALSAVGILIWRRPDQFQNPYVWVEEGTVTLPAYLAHGWMSLLEPVAGYIVLPAKLIFFMAASLSFTHLPRIEYWLTVAFEVGTLAMVAYSPSRLRFPVLCALAVALVPTDAEVFAVSEYAFWWGSLWSFVAIFWDDRERERTGWRCTLALVGGLSSPMALPAAAMFAFRAAVNRRRADVLVLAVAILAAGAQAWTMHKAGVLGGGSLSGVSVMQTITRYFGDFSLAWTTLPDNVVGVVGLAVMCGGLLYAVRCRKWSDPWFLMIGGLLIAAILAGVVRMPPNITHPFTAGPRYYFFPYMFLAWAFLYALPDIGWVPRVAIGLLFVGALVQFAAHGSRVHDRLSWRGELRQCSASGDIPYPVKIHYDGNASRAWHVDLTGKQCDDLMGRSLFR